MPQYDVTVNGRHMNVGLAPGGRVTVDGEPLQIDVRQISEHSFSILLGGQSITLLVEKTEESYNVMTAAVLHDVHVVSERDRILKAYARRTGSAVSRLEIHAPMPALVVKIEVGVGDHVARGTGLLVLEAMKMENELKAHQTGRVKEIYVTAGRPVEKGELLMLLEEDPETTNEAMTGMG